MICDKEQWRSSKKVFFHMDLNMRLSKLHIERGCWLVKNSWKRYRLLRFTRSLYTMLISIRWRNPIFSFRVPQAKEDWLLLQGHRHSRPAPTKFVVFIMHHAIQTRKYFALVIWRSKQGQPIFVGPLLSSKASDVEHASECLWSVTCKSEC